MKLVQYICRHCIFKYVRYSYYVDIIVAQSVFAEYVFLIYQHCKRS